MPTVDQIMKAYTPYGKIPRNEARDVIDALRTIPSFREETWTNSVAYGRYTSPSGRWTAEDESGQVEITWSVNAANSVDNGYSIDRDSWWMSYLRKSAIAYVDASKNHIKWLQEKAACHHRNADRSEQEAQKFVVEAYRNIFAAANSRRLGERRGVVNLEWAARARRNAKLQKEYAVQERTSGALIDREIDNENCLIGYINARIVAGGEMLKNWYKLATLDCHSHHVGENTPDGITDFIPTWERELFHENLAD